MGSAASTSSHSASIQKHRDLKKNAEKSSSDVLLSVAARAKRQEAKETRAKILWENPELQAALYMVHLKMKEIDQEKKDDLSEKNMSMKTLDNLKYIYGLYFDHEKMEHRKIIGDELANDNAGCIFTEYFRVTCGGEESPVGPKSECLLWLRRNCWNHSDASLELCKEFGKKGLIPLLVKSLLTHTDSYGDDENILKSIVMPEVGILHNAAKVADNKKYYKQANAVSALVPYAKAESPELKMFAIMTLAYVVDEQDNEIISTDDSMIRYILNYLDIAIKASNHRSSECSAEELVSGLMRLASNGENSSTIVNAGILPMLAKLMREGSAMEKETCAKTVWVLAFNDKNKEKIIEEQDLVASLKEMGEGAEGPGKNHASKALWVLNNVRTVNEAKKKVHVMISYQWDCQKLMIKIKNELEANGYRVWIDVESMSGSTLEAMSEAVENSAVVLMSMSPNYKESPDCRTEAEYAYKLKRPIIPLRIEPSYEPDGWLGAILGAKLYYDFSNLMAFESSLSKLVKEIGDRGKEDSQLANIAPRLVSPPFGFPLSTEDKPPNQWSKREVSTWAEKNGIVARKVLELDGATLEYLSVLKMKAPEFFYKFSSKKLGIVQLRDLMRLDEGLDNLSL